jgi:hypothetical protein
MTRQQLARLAGAFYLAMSLPGGFAIVFIPSAFVSAGNATATAAHIAAAPALYRAGVVADLLCVVFAICTAMVLYELFRDVDRLQARLMIGFVFCMAAIGLVDTVLLAAPIVLTSGASYLAALEKNQLDALTLAVLGLRNQELRVATMFWGLWLVPVGILVYKSGFLPRLLGVLVLIAAGSYVIDSLAYFVLPAQAYTISLLSVPAQFAGEMGFTFWMLIKGVRAERVGNA